MPLSNTWTPSLTCTLPDTTVSGLSIDLDGTYTKVEYDTAPSWVTNYGWLSNTEPGYVFIRTYNSNNYVIDIVPRTVSTWVWGIFNNTTELWVASGVNTYTNSTIVPCPSGENWVLLDPPVVDLYTTGGGSEPQGIGDSSPINSIYGYNYSNSPEVLASKNYGLNIGSRRSIYTITPTFDRDFVTYGTLNHGTGPNITFTRASSATVFTSTGILSTVPNDVPRFEWGSFRTNLLRYSQNLTSGLGWFVNPLGTVLTPVADTGPFNTSITTFYLTGNGSSPGECFSLPIDGQYQPYLTFSFFAKLRPDAPRDFVGFQFWQNADSPFFYNTGSYTFSLTGNNSDSTYVKNITKTSYPNNWQRFTCLLSANPGNGLGVFYPTSRIDIETDASNLYSNYIWGLQVETGLSATNYIPTTNTPVTTGVPLGLLIEESRTNVVRYSGEISTGVNRWSTFEAGISGNYLAPDNSLSAAKLVENANNSSHTLILPVNTTIPVSSVSTASIFAKAQERSRFRLVLWDSANPGNAQATATFDLLSGVVVSTSSTSTPPGSASSVVSALISPYSNGWYRCSVTGTPNLSSSGLSTGTWVYMMTGSSTTYPGDGTSGILFWGGQVEQGAFPTSYIPTAGLSATRQADDARVSSINTSSFYNQDQGTIFMETQYLPYRFNTGSNPGLWTLDTGAFAQGYGIWYGGTSSNLTLYTRNIALNTATSISTNTTTPPVTRSAAVISPTFRALGCNGSIAGTNTTPYVFPPITTFRIGFNYIAGSPSVTIFGGYIRKVTYWPSRLSNNRLRTLTLSA